MHLPTLKVNLALTRVRLLSTMISWTRCLPRSSTDHTHFVRKQTSDLKSSNKSSSRLQTSTKLTTKREFRWNLSSVQNKILTPSRSAWTTKKSRPKLLVNSKLSKLKINKRWSMISERRNSMMQNVSKSSLRKPSSWTKKRIKWGKTNSLTIKTNCLSRLKKGKTETSTRTTWITLIWSLTLVYLEV